MPTWDDRVLESGWVSVDDVLFNPDNYRVHPKAQSDALGKLIGGVGWVRRLLINLRTSPEWGKDQNVRTLLDGHARCQEAARRGQTKVPVDYVDLTPEEEATVLASLDVVTGMGGVDRYKLSQLITKGKKDDKSLEALAAVAKKARLSEINTDGLTSLDKISGELPGVRQLKQWAQFPSDLPWGFPEIRTDRILRDVPENLQSWVGPKHDYDNPDYFLYQWGSDSVKGLDLSKTIVSFYVQDYRFDNFWYSPPEYTGKLINAGVMGAVMPNYSVAAGDPLIVRMWQRYRSLWIGRYFQEADIPIIPDIPIWSGAEDNEMLAIGIPQNIPIAIQMHTKMTPEKWNSKIANLKWMLNKLNPSLVIIYADDKGWLLTSEALSQHECADRLQWVKDRVGVRRVYMDGVESEEI